MILNASIKESQQLLKSMTTTRQLINWAVKTSVNKELTFLEFKESLLFIGIKYNDLKQCSNQLQQYSNEIGEIRMRGVSKKLVTELVNISKNIGIDLSDMLKPKIREIVDAYPDHLKVKRVN